MGDVHAGHAPEGLMDPADSWDTLGTPVVAARGSPGTREGRAVSHSGLEFSNLLARGDKEATW